MTTYTALRDRGFLTRCAETLEEFVAFVDEFCRDWPYTYDAWCEGPELDAASFCAARDEAIAAGRVMTANNGKHQASEGSKRLTFPSGATLTVTGGYITGRIDPEPQRAPLPDSDAWRYTGKERDDFPDFTVTHEQVIDFILPANRPAPKGSTLHAHPGKGSALLLG